MTLRGAFKGFLRSQVVLTDQEGNRSRLRRRRGAVTFEVSPSPAFLEGVKACREVRLGPPEYGEPPDAKRRRLASLDSLDGWRLVSTADPVLDNGNFDYPRQKGTFEVSVVEDEARGRCLQFALKSSGGRPPYVPAYQSLAPKKPVELPGKPTAIGLHVRGNSGWGRVHFDLRDAKGERWLSIGMPAWNTNDNESLSYLIFDGWRWMQIPLPGHYPSGYHWPRQCNWRNGTPDKTGDGVVDYPLQLVGIVVEQRERIVYVNEMVDASRQPVRLRDVAVLYGDPEAVGDWAAHGRQARPW
jgi:hypothetical protein